MADNLSQQIEIIVNTLLHVSDWVIEVSADCAVTNAWHKQHVVPAAGDGLSARGSEIVLQTASQVKDAFQTGEKSIIEIKLDDTSYIGRILPIHPGKGFLFITLEQLNYPKEAEKQLEQQKNFYENILNHIAADIVVFDAELKYVYLNPIAVKSAEERKYLIGKTDEDYCRYKGKPLSIAEKRMFFYKKAIAEKQIIEFEEKSVTPEGETLYHVRRIWPIFKVDGTLDLIFGYGLNITDFVVSRQTLKTSQETFASAFDYSGIGMALMGTDRKWLDVNNEICRITGYSKEELLNLSFQDITYPEDLKTDLEYMHKMLRNEISTYTLERRCIAKDKSSILISLTASLVWNSDHTPKFFIFQAIDITKKKELENELTKKNDELEATKSSLINKISQLEELSHIIAHNLRGPAANNKILADALMAKLIGGRSATENPLSNSISMEEGIGFIQESSDSLLNNLATLMELTQIKLNKELSYSDCKLESIINEIANQLQSYIYEKQPVINLKLDVGIITYPKAYLISIMYNLLSNALKYSRPSVVPEVTIYSTKKDNKIQIGVKDNGLGIDLNRYGDKVFKLNQVFHHGFDSRGVGLYITKTQIESLGGSIEVKSELNKGSEFIVTL